MIQDIYQTRHAGFIETLVRFFKQRSKLDAYRDQVQHERHELANLSDRSLADIGLTREQALRESRRSYWDVPANRCKDTISKT